MNTVSILFFDDGRYESTPVAVAASGDPKVVAAARSRVQTWLDGFKAAAWADAEAGVVPGPHLTAYRTTHPWPLPGSDHGIPDEVTQQAFLEVEAVPLLTAEDLA